MSLQKACLSMLACELQQDKRIAVIRCQSLSTEFSHKVKSSNTATQNHSAKQLNLSILSSNNCCIPNRLREIAQNGWRNGIISIRNSSITSWQKERIALLLNHITRRNRTCGLLLRVMGLNILKLIKLDSASYCKRIRNGGLIT